MAQLPSKNKRSGPHLCKDCGTDLAGMNVHYNRLYCDSCRQERQELYLATIRRKRKRKWREQSGIQYAGQLNSKDNLNYLISQGNCFINVAKVCHKCKRTNEDVKGRWGPIYSDTDLFGNETTTILLCLRCYEAEMDRFN